MHQEPISDRSMAGLDIRKKPVRPIHALLESGRSVQECVSLPFPFRSHHVWRDQGVFALYSRCESGRLEYRFEAFNLLNATHLSLPNTGLTNSNFGRILSTDGDPRILQMALKLLW